MIILSGSHLSAGENADWSTQAGFEHSAIALMPEGEPENVDAFAPLHPTVMAWGIDPVFHLDDLDGLRARFEAYRSLGVTRRAVNVWMLTATPRILHEHPEFQDAVCLDITGDRIVPTWLADGFYEGTPSYWGCTNHPLFRSQIIARARAGIAAGANLLHLDDHMGTAAAAVHAGGCFCDACMAAFRVWLIGHLTQTDRMVLGLPELSTFSYRDWVRNAGFTTLESYQDGIRDHAIPLRAEFLTFQREAAAAFVKELRGIVADEAGSPIPVGVNAWNLAPTQMATAHEADYFANEIQHYDEEDLIPPTSYLLASALGKPVFATGTGEDWIRIGVNENVTRVRRWIATAHAFGHYFMYAYRKWGFTPETGTQWYTTPVETFKPLTDFISDNQGLFDGFEAVAQVGLLYNNATSRHDDWTVREIARQLHDAGYSCALAVAGDSWLQHELTENELDSWSHLIVPANAIPDGAQGSIVHHRLADGRARIWNGLNELPKTIQPWIQRQGPGRLWMLPRKKIGPSTTTLAIHLLNQDYDAETDSMIPVTNTVLSISHDLIGKPLTAEATLHAPGKTPLALLIEEESDAVVIRIPSVELWSILSIETESGI